MRSGGIVIWLTGLSGAGKTTLAVRLQEAIPNSILLDGDSLREVLGFDKSGYDAESRKRLAFVYSRLANLLARQGFVVIVATISLYHDIHAWNRENFPAYLEVFLDIPLAVRQGRDPKGLYAREKLCIQGNMAGGGVKVELPVNPDIILTEANSLEESVKILCERLLSE